MRFAIVILTGCLFVAGCEKKPDLPPYNVNKPVIEPLTSERDEAFTKGGHTIPLGTEATGSGVGLTPPGPVIGSGSSGTMPPPPKSNSSAAPGSPPSMLPHDSDPATPRRLPQLPVGGGD